MLTSVLLVAARFNLHIPLLEGRGRGMVLGWA